jgi:hypothetical protein
MLDFTLVFTNPNDEDVYNVSEPSERLQQQHRDAIGRAIASFLESDVSDVPVRVDAFSYETGLVTVAFIGNDRIGTASVTRDVFIQQTRRVQFCVPVLWELEGGLCLPAAAPEPFTTAPTNSPEPRAPEETPDSDVSAGVSEDADFGVAMSGPFIVAIAAVTVIILFGIGYVLVESKNKQVDMVSAATIHNPAADAYVMRMEALQGPHRSLGLHRTSSSSGMPTGPAMSLGLTPARSLSGIPSMGFSGTETSGI